MRKVHFIAIGGAIMHNLAMALKNKGYDVTGSDDEIFEPSKSRLESYGLLPDYFGWDENKITKDIDAVIVGMHAREDNPELKKALQMGIKVYSFPEFMYEKTKNKKRIVIAGSHGKTTITSMIIHVLKSMEMKFDYLVGSQIEGFETMVDISDDAEIAVFEGDEYLTSPLNRVPKFYHYQPNIAVLSGIAWDHYNVYPTFKEYVDQFRILIDRMMDDGILFFDMEDNNINLLKLENETKISVNPYSAVKYQNTENGTIIEEEGIVYYLPVFGHHNMKNINAARLSCNNIGINNHSFFKAMQNFSGAKRRLEVLSQNEKYIAYTDFAHAPSKVKATLEALKEKYLKRKLIAILELHTFSSLNKEFLPQYKNTLDKADQAIVYLNSKVLKHKNLDDISGDELMKFFNNSTLNVIFKSEELERYIQKLDKENAVIVFMSSGNFSGINLQALMSE